MGKLRKGESAGEAGFTLIEIVMVLVLLGILAALAVPKYFDTLDMAEKKSVDYTVSIVQSRIHSKFSELLLNGVTCTEAISQVRHLSDIADASDGEGVRFGDFIFSPSQLEDGRNGTQMMIRDLGETKTFEAYLFLPVCNLSDPSVSVTDETRVLMESFGYLIWSGYNFGAKVPAQNKILSMNIGETWNNFSVDSDLLTSSVSQLWPGMDLSSGWEISKGVDGTYKVLIMDSSNPDIGWVQTFNADGTLSSEGESRRIRRTETGYQY